MKTYQKGQLLQCPNCLTFEEDPVEDYPVFDRVGENSSASHSCGACGKFFTVTKESEDRYSVIAGDFE